jgi:hypothetical protein
LDPWGDASTGGEMEKSRRLNRQSLPFGRIPQATPHIIIINQQADFMLRAASGSGFTPVSLPGIRAGGALPSAAPGWDKRDRPQKSRPSLDKILASHPTTAA